MRMHCMNGDMVLRSVRFVRVFFGKAFLSSTDSLPIFALRKKVMDKFMSERIKHFRDTPFKRNGKRVRVGANSGGDKAGDIPFMP